jgi:hypothetical protein
VSGYGGRGGGWKNDYVVEVVVDGGFGCLVEVEVANDGGFGCFEEVVEGWRWVGDVFD